VRPRVLLAVTVTVALCLLFVRLGFWQLDRAAQKAERRAQIEARQQMAPVDLEGLLALEPAQRQFRAVVLAGEYLPGRVLLLDNAIRDGRVGYEVLHPFRSADGALVLVNRGFVAGGPTRADLPEVPRVPGPVFLLASYYQPEPRPPVAEAAGGWPRVIQTLDWPGLRAAVAPDLLPVMLRIDADSPGALRAEWPDLQMKADTHRAYALQWFTFAALLPVLVALAARSRRSRRQDSEDSR
jgi:cytochrome oxidase assembly protein ShyY1